jgi:hypothetical protein
MACAYPHRVTPRHTQETPTNNGRGQVGTRHKHVDSSARTGWMEAGPSVKLTMKIGRPTRRNAHRIPKDPACEQQQPGTRVGGGFRGQDAEARVSGSQAGGKRVASVNDCPSPRRRKCVHSSTAWGRRPRAGPSVSYGLGGQPSDDAACNPLVLRHVSFACF